MMSGPLVQAELAGGRGGPAAAGDKDLATEPSGDPGPQPRRLVAAQHAIRHTRKDLLLVETHPTSLGRPASSIKNPAAPCYAFVRCERRT